MTINAGRALAGAALLLSASQAQAASTFDFKVDGQWTIVSALFDPSTGDTFPPTTWIDLSPITGSIDTDTRTGYIYAPMEGVWGQAYISDVHFSGNSMRIEGFPAAYGYWTLDLNFDGDLGGTYPQSVKNFIDGHFSLLAYAVGGLSVTISGPAELSYTNMTAVPEPASWALLVAGLGLTGAALRRRNVAVAFG